MMSYLAKFRDACGSAVGGTILLGLCSPAISLAQIRTDGSVGLPAQSLSGPRFVIPETLGKLSGSNLFHSFQTFNVNAGESATFTTSSANIANVISRVTGGNLSQINGRISLTAASGAPNFYFINPAGVTFGAGASVNVPGALHVSTANYLKFADGIWYADAKTASTFSSAPPEAFGFLGTTRAAITTGGNAAIAAKAGQSLGVTAGDIAMDSGSLKTIGADIRMAVVGADKIEVPINGALPAASGNLTMRNGALIQTDAIGARDGGNIVISAGDIVIEGTHTAVSGIFTSSLAGNTGKAGNVEVAATRDITVIDGGAIATNTDSTGDAGSLKLRARNVTLDSRNNQDYFTGIGSNAEEGSGNGGPVDITASGAITIVNGGLIGSPTFSNGNAGVVNVTASTITIDAQGNSFIPTGITSAAFQGSRGAAGSLNVTSTGATSIRNGGVIDSSTFAIGNAGSVRVNAGSIHIDGGNQGVTGISSSARVDSSGHAGTVDVTTAGRLTIVLGGGIDSSTFGLGDAGLVKVNAGSILIDGTGSIVTSLTGISSTAQLGSKGKAGGVDVSTTDSLSILTNGQISSVTNTAAKGGSVKVDAGSLMIDGANGTILTGIFSSNATPQSTGDAGNIDVAVASSMKLVNGGAISSSTYSSGKAGSVTVRTDQIAIDSGTADSTGIFSATAGGGDAGNIDLTATNNLFVVNGGVISSETFAAGKAGAVKVSAGSILIDGQRFQERVTGIFSDANASSSGSAGTVDVAALTTLDVKNFGIVSSDAYATGKAGALTVTAQSIALATYGVIRSDARAGSSGDAGSIEVTVAGNLSATNGGRISSSTSGAGKGGAIKVTAGSVELKGDSAIIQTGIASQANSSSTGNAGSVDVTVAGTLSLRDEAQISSATQGRGNGGPVKVNAGTILIDGTGRGAAGTGIFSQSENGMGDAGNVDVSATGNLTLANGGVISSSTGTRGTAGSVNVKVGTLLIGSESGISSLAAEGSSGITGNINVIATDSMSLVDGGKLTIENDASVAQPLRTSATDLIVTAPTIALGRNSQITAASSGNVNASNIRINFTDRLSLRSTSSITTSANNGNGGAITVRGGEVIELNQSQITTSVSGTTGRGGDIAVTANALVMQTGFIQANTAAAGSNGGDVRIDVRTLVPSTGTLSAGSQKAFAFDPAIAGFNVIQAAAPTGLSGDVRISSPALNIAGSLVGLAARLTDVVGLGRNPCRTALNSSFSQTGRGGFAPSARNLLGPQGPVVVPATRSPSPVSILHEGPLSDDWRCGHR